MRITVFVTATPSTDTFPPEWLVALGSALLGALVGGWLAYLAQRRAYTQSEKDRLRAALDALSAEIATIRRETTDRVRSTPGPSDRPPPLPTVAWRHFLSVVNTDLVGREELSGIAEFYRNVDRANEYSRQVDTYLLVALTAGDPVVRDGAREAIAHVSQAPILDLPTKADAAEKLAGAARERV